MTTLSTEEARRLYDRIGRRQDRHACYENPATERLIELADFSSARAVFELGCGTGRFARRLLEEHLPETATYRALDLSSTMVELTRRRLRPWADRVRVDLAEGAPPGDEPTGAYDRFVSNFVFDLLPVETIRTTLLQAHRMLRPDGLLCLCGLSTGTGPLSRAVAAAIRGLHAWRPSLVGGCRPIDSTELLDPSEWIELEQDTIVSWGIPAQVVVTRRRPFDGEQTGENGMRSEPS